MLMDHYSTLGLDHHASKDDIKRAFRQLALNYHPDRQGNPLFAACRQRRYVSRHVQAHVWDRREQGRGGRAF